MSRYRDWTNAWSGAAIYLDNIDKKIDVNNVIKKYSKLRKISGSFSDKCLTIGKNWLDFKNYVDSTFKPTNQ